MTILIMMKKQKTTGVKRHIYNDENHCCVTLNILQVSLFKALRMIH